MFKAFLLGTLLLLGVQVFAQNSFSISGVVKDQIGALPGAAVYLSGYKIATVTAVDGQFSLDNLKPGNYDILVQMMGYLPYSKNILISDRSVKVEVFLKENTITLNQVVIRVDPNRAKYINQFKELFIGKSPNAKFCKILNPHVLRVDYDYTKSLLTVQTDDFLVVENKALGYRVKYMLDYFEYNNRTNIIYYAGKPFFEELKSTKTTRKKYIDNRETAYHGSAQHFFKSLYQNQTIAEGFVIQKIIKVPNPNRAPDSIISKNILLIKNPPGKTGIRTTAAKPDTSLLGYWLKQQALPKYIDRFNNAEVIPDTLLHYFNKDLKYINFTNALCISYTKERESTVYSNSGFWIFRPLYIPDYQLSKVNLTAGAVRFYENGGILDSRSMLFEGFWAYEKVADMVPMDYIPISKR